MYSYLLIYTHNGHSLHKKKRDRKIIYAQIYFYFNQLRKIWKNLIITEFLFA